MTDKTRSTYWALAESINTGFQSFPGWNEAYISGTRSSEWESGYVRAMIDVVNWLRDQAEDND